MGRAVPCTVIARVGPTATPSVGSATVWTATWDPLAGKVSQVSRGGVEDSQLWPGIHPLPQDQVVEPDQSVRNLAIPSWYPESTQLPVVMRKPQATYHGRNWVHCQPFPRVTLQITVRAYRSKCRQGWSIQYGRGHIHVCHVSEQQCMLASMCMHIHVL